MKSVVLACVLTGYLCTSQVLLEPNGLGNTYGEITAVLAPNYSPIETPDCNHSAFGDTRTPRNDHGCRFGY